MKKLPGILLFALFPLLSVTAKDEAPPVVWSLTDGIEAPESAYHDARTKTVFLSQIGKGGGMADDGDGWISKLSADGKMIDNKWVTGLSAPKGIRVHKGTLWVSDITRLVAIDIAAGKIVKKVTVEGAKFLNDVAAGPDGTIYVSDMVAGRIYAHKQGKTTVLAEGPGIQHPNGLLVHRGRLIIGGWGSNLQDDFSTDPVGHLLAIHLRTKKLTQLTGKPLGNLDGVEIDGKGGYVVTDWRAGKVFHVTGKGKATTLLTLPQGTADHAYLTDRKLLILPRMKDNAVTAYDLSGFLK